MTEKELQFTSVGLDTNTDLGLDLLGCVSEEDGGGWVAGAHLGLRALQCREEGGVDEGRFVIAEARSDVSGHAEVGILKQKVHEPSKTKHKTLKHYPCPWPCACPLDK